MPHIDLPPGLPGIIGLLTAFPETAEPLGRFTEALLRGPSPLTPAERELIAARVSGGNECAFCSASHSAAARVLWGAENADAVDAVRDEPERAPIGDKLKALLAIADKVRLDGRLVEPADVERAKHAGADDRAIHDTVLIAAAFCMFNRYVDGLGTLTPREPRAYEEIGRRLATDGYVLRAPAEHA